MTKWRTALLASICVIALLTGVFTLRWLWWKAGPEVYRTSDEKYTYSLKVVPTSPSPFRMLLGASDHYVVFQIGDESVTFTTFSLYWSSNPLDSNNAHIRRTSIEGEDHVLFEVDGRQLECRLNSSTATWVER
jgi:hypothetical protein